MRQLPAVDRDDDYESQTLKMEVRLDESLLHLMATACQGDPLPPSLSISYSIGVSQSPQKDALISLHLERHNLGSVKGFLTLFVLLQNV